MQEAHKFRLTGFLKGRAICLLSTWKMLAGVVQFTTCQLHSANWEKAKSSWVKSEQWSGSSQQPWTRLGGERKGWEEKEGRGGRKGLCMYKYIFISLPVGISLAGLMSAQVPSPRIHVEGGAPDHSGVPTCPDQNTWTGLLYTAGKKIEPLSIYGRK